MSSPAEKVEIKIDDCWNRIGVWGKQTPRCAKLDNVVHCRNCEIYSAAGRQVLERELPNHYEADWARVYAVKKQKKLVGTESITIFRLGEEWFSLPTHVIREITEIRTVHKIPHNKTPVLRGLVNLRGQLKICVSFGRLMGIDKSATDRHSSRRFQFYERMLAISNNGSEFVFLVSEVKDTYRYHPNELQDPPATLSQAQGTYTRGILSWNEHEVAVLDAELLFYSLTKSLA